MKHVFIAATILLSCTVTAQQNTVTTGGDASGTNGSVSYTIGQIDYVYVENGSNSANAGVQQPYEFFIVGLNDLNYITALYPNPTYDELNLKIENPENMTFRIFDASGRLILEKASLTSENIISVTSWAKGNYNLQLFSNGETVETVKIIKH